jgi:hypothetical protein
MGKMKGLPYKNGHFGLKWPVCPVLAGMAAFDRVKWEDV